MIAQVRRVTGEVPHDVAPARGEVAEDRLGLVIPASIIDQVGQIVGRLGAQCPGDREEPDRLVRLRGDLETQAACGLVSPAFCEVREYWLVGSKRRTMM